MLNVPPGRGLFDNELSAALLPTVEDARRRRAPFMTLHELNETLPPGLCLTVGEDTFVLTFRNLDAQLNPGQDRGLTLTLNFVHEIEHAIREANLD